MAIDDNTSYELTGYQVKDLAQKVRAKADSSSLANVATSGLYSDLIGAPTIPTVYNGELTIQHNGTTKGTFTANQSSASTVNIETIYADTIAPATPVAPISTGMIADGAVTSAKIDWTTTAQSYSTTEIDTGATWIDGKPIYKKTVDTGALPNTTGKNIAHGIANFGDLVKIEGGAIQPGVSWLPLPYSDITTAGVVGVFLNNTNIYIFAGNNRSNLTKSYVTLYYTKTTD